MSLLNLFHKTKFSVQLRFPDEVSAVGEARQLKQQHFSVSLVPPSQAGGAWQGSAEITLNGKNVTKERVRNYLETLIKGYDGEWTEDA